jgi:type VI secretion system secreted protein VgrG
VPNILRKVFEGFEVAYELKESDYRPREYCVQYRETDFNFASRLMEEEGIYYYFEHSENGKDKLIIADSPQSHRDCPGKSEIEFSLRVLSEDLVPTAINSWHLKHKHQSGKYTLWDHHFQLPFNKLQHTQPTSVEVGNNQKLEIYDYPGGYAERYDGIDKVGGEQAGNLNNVFEDRQRTAKVRMQELDARHKTISGTSDCATFAAGYKFKLS